jgi:hypothetical protein
MPEDQTHQGSRCRARYSVESEGKFVTLRSDSPDTPVEPSSAPLSDGSFGTTQQPVKQHITQSTAVSTPTSSMAPPTQLAPMPKVAAKPSIALGQLLARHLLGRPELRSRVTQSTCSSMPPSSTIRSKLASAAKNRGKQKRNKNRKKRESENANANATIVTMSLSNVWCNG